MCMCVYVHVCWWMACGVADDLGCHHCWQLHLLVSLLFISTPPLVWMCLNVELHSHVCISSPFPLKCCRYIWWKSFISVDFKVWSYVKLHNETIKVQNFDRISWNWTSVCFLCSLWDTQLSATLWSSASHRWLYYQDRMSKHRCGSVSAKKKFAIEWVLNVSSCDFSFTLS